MPRAGAPCRPLVLSSVRDILVGRDDGGRHDERAALLANEHLDGVLVHSDPAFARFEESFRPTTPLAIPVHHTGFVVPPRRSARRRSRRRLLVSAGGGMVGEGLLSVAADAAPALHARTGLTTTLVAGPFLPDAARRHLQSRRGPLLEVVDRVDDLCGEVASSAASLSQAGYNTTLDIVRAGRPAVVVPYADSGEDEQTRRAARMAELGVLRVVAAAELTPARLVAEVVAALAAPPPAVGLDLGGRERSTEIVAALVAARRRAAVVMSGGWLDPVRAALDATTGPVRWWFRDDDAGWADDALWALLDVFEGAGVAVDVAAIPAAVTGGCARRLAARVVGGLVHVHQHGLAHTNHELVGRKCEFGLSRGRARQSADIRAGRELLEDRMGAPIEPVFTPPWNRCSADTAEAVLAAGHVVLSRDVSAGRLDRPGLAEIPVSIDWSSDRHATLDDLGRAIAADVLAGGTVGVMLHHAVMDAADRRHLASLLALVASSPTAIPTTVLALAAAQRSVSPHKSPRTYAVTQNGVTARG